MIQPTEPNIHVLLERYLFKTGLLAYPLEDNLTRVLIKQDLSLREIFIHVHTKEQNIETVRKIVSDLCSTGGLKRQITIIGGFTSDHPSGVYNPVIVDKAKEIRRTFGHPRVCIRLMPTFRLDMRWNPPSPEYLSIIGPGTVSIYIDSETDWGNVEGMLLSVATLNIETLQCSYHGYVPAIPTSAIIKVARSSGITRLIIYRYMVNRVNIEPADTKHFSRLDSLPDPVGVDRSHLTLQYEDYISTCFIKELAAFYEITLKLTHTRESSKELCEKLRICRPYVSRVHLSGKLLASLREWNQNFDPEVIYKLTISVSGNQAKFLPWECMTNLWYVALDAQYMSRDTFMDILKHSSIRDVVVTFCVPVRRGMTVIDCVSIALRVESITRLAIQTYGQLKCLTLPLFTGICEQLTTNTVIREFRYDGSCCCAIIEPYELRKLSYMMKTNRVLSRFLVPVKIPEECVEGFLDALKQSSITDISVLGSLHPLETLTRIALVICENRNRARTQKHIALCHKLRGRPMLDMNVLRVISDFM